MMEMFLNTSELRAGDRIKMHGATILVEDQPNTYIGHGGRTVYSWPDLWIIEGEIDMFPWMRTWTIQGNELATWFVERD